MSSPRTVDYQGQKAATFLWDEGQQVTACGPNPACRLFPNGPGAKKGFYIFKWL